MWSLLLYVSYFFKVKAYSYSLELGSRCVLSIGVSHSGGVAPCCRRLWQDDAWGASEEDAALVTPQLDFGFHKASPLFTLTGCAGYWPGKSGQDGLSCKEEGGWWCIGSFWDLSLKCCWRRPVISLCSYLFSRPTIYLRSHYLVFVPSSHCWFCMNLPMPCSPSQSPGHSSLLSRGLCVGGCRDLWLLHLNEPH